MADPCNWIQVISGVLQQAIRPRLPSSPGLQRGIPESTGHDGVRRGQAAGRDAIWKTVHWRYWWVSEGQTEGARACLSSPLLVSIFSFWMYDVLVTVIYGSKYSSYRTPEVIMMQFVDICRQYLHCEVQKHNTILQDFFPNAWYVRRRRRTHQRTIGN